MEGSPQPITVQIEVRVGGSSAELEMVQCRNKGRRIIDCYIDGVSLLCLLCDLQLIFGVCCITIY